MFVLSFRLPIVQGGGSLAFVGPTFSILSLPQWRCPDLSGKLTSIKAVFFNFTFFITLTLTDNVCLFQDNGNSTASSSIDQTEVWQIRMREVMCPYRNKIELAFYSRKKTSTTTVSRNIPDVTDTATNIFKPNTFLSLNTILNAWKFI